MKMITKRGIFLWILAVAFLFGLGFMTYSLVENGDTWVMKTYNTHIYKNGDLIGAGTIKSADGAVLAETQDGKRVYAEDPTERKATLHTVGDTKVTYRRGVALETQFYPDSLHCPNFPVEFVKAGVPFTTTTEFRFDTK